MVEKNMLTGKGAKTMERIRKSVLVFTASLFLLCGGMQVMAQDLMEMSLDDLLDMEVTSVSKKAERLQDVASSLYVLTSENIKSSGATSLHEVLMGVPGYWGIQDEYSSVSPVIRNSPASNGSRGTVLYLLDGTPIQDIMASSFSFKNFDIPVEEIERIEVIRGSGGTIYGANSATGVVNIFTKTPEQSEGVEIDVAGAAAGLNSVSLRAGSQIGDNLSVAGYGKMRMFNGFGFLPEFDGEIVTVPVGETGTDSIISNRFTSNYDKSVMVSGGLKATYKINDDSKVAFTSHYNSAQQTTYTNYDTELSLIGAPDVLVENDVNRSRFVANMRYDHNFSDQHSIFVRASTNIENDFLNLLGGYKVDNSILDIEAQDNFSINSTNDLSLGVNYRAVKFDVYDINAVDAVRYVDPQAVENLTGAFVQDKVNLLDGKLPLLLGIKAENYSLIDDNFYLSPMAKVSFIPTEDLTIWGGYTQSYTTPGYNNTNIDLLLLQTLSDETVTGMATQGVYEGVYQQTYAQVIANGGDAATADAQATGAAAAFVGSPTGQATISATAEGIRGGLPNNVGVINGAETAPTQYRTMEVGFRASIMDGLSLESNVYYSSISDGITASATPVLINEESLVNPGEFADYYVYGNYIKGVTYGTETLIRYIPSIKTQFEFAHTFTKSEWEYQHNVDFDIDDETVVDPDEIDRTPEIPVMPEHLFKLKGHFQLPADLKMSVGVVYASKFSSQANYDFINQRYPSILSGGGTKVASNSDRTFINFRAEKMFMDDMLTVYAFGNDITNKGMVASTSALDNATLSQIGALYGVGVAVNF